MYTTKRDAATVLYNSGYENIYLVPDEVMNTEQAEEIIDLMWQRNLCPGCALRVWLEQHEEDLNDWRELLPEEGHDCEAEEDE